MKHANWTDFNDYVNRAFCLWKITLPIDPKEWKTGSCTCPTYMKEYFCKHLIGIAIFTKRLLVPNTCKAMPLGQNRKKGRPVLAVNNTECLYIFVSGC